MSRSFRFAFAPLAAIVTAGLLTGSLLDSTGCTSSTEAPLFDASLDFDGAPAPEHDGQASQPQDGGTDATVPTDAGKDETTDAARALDGSSDDAGYCAAILARLTGSPIQPPNRWGGLDLSNGGVADGGPATGGLTIDQAGILACATSVEPDVFTDGGTPGIPGARTATFANGEVTVSYNLDSRAIWQVAENAPVTSTLTFHARPGGAYDTGAPDGGSSVYAIGFGGDGGIGYVTKNGADDPADWSTVYDDGGMPHASAWVNEIYDGIMATYAPLVPAVADCLTAQYARPIVPQIESACLVVPGWYLGIRPLGTYVQFANDGTNHATTMYNFWPGAWPSCATPHAAIESAESAPIQEQFNAIPALGPVWTSPSIGGFVPGEPVGNPNGMLVSEANALFGCSAQTVTAPDPGYAAEQWGSGALEVEYNPDSGVAYKVFAQPGYLGTLGLASYEEDGGYNSYAVQIGTAINLNGASEALDWSDGDAGALNGQITDISNGWLDAYCGIEDTDCVQAGDCTIVPDDGNGHSTFSVVASQAVVTECGEPFPPVTFVFPKGSSAPSQISTTNPGGQ